MNDIEIIKIVADEQCRQMLRELLPVNMPYKFSDKKSEHAFYLVQRCRLMKVTRRLNMKDWGE